MPRFNADTLRTTLSLAFAALGFPGDEAELISRLMVLANLSGHETHGVRLLARYHDWVAKGHIVPGAPVTVVDETETTAVLDGHMTLGHVAATRAVELAIDKARKMRVSAVGVRNLSHIGRAGAYPEMAAEQGMICLAFVCAQGMGRLVTPFGGIARRIGTNPISAAFPYPGRDPILLDFATSTVAANKIRVASERESSTGEGWMLDESGQPTTDPADFSERPGMILPLGGDQGHKGYGLAVMVDLLSGILAGAGTAIVSSDRLNNGTFFITLDPGAFVASEAYAQQVAALADYLRETPTAPGAPKVMVPGDFESEHRRARERDGIDIESPAWSAVASALRDLGVPVPEPDAPGG